MSNSIQRQRDDFASRLIKRARHLRRWPSRRDITCFRLYEKDVPDVPLVVDRYEDHLHIGEFERPHERSESEHEQWLETMVQTAADVLEVAREKTFFKHRKRQRGTTQHEAFGSQGYEIFAREGGLTFIVNLSDYVDTGLFLDHRITRGLFRGESAGKRVLNLFAYTGSFSVYAASGGATSTTTVDWSNTYIAWAQRNMKHNGFSGNQHQFVAMDALRFVKTLPKEPLYDLVVIDPPTFSNSKRTDQDWQVQDGYADLINQTLRRTSPGGVIYFSNNFRQFKMDEGSIRGASVREISRQTVPEDFRNQRIHRCWRIIKDAT